MLSAVFVAAALAGAPTPRAAAAHAGTVVFVERVGGPWAAAAVRSNGKLKAVALRETTGGWTIVKQSGVEIRPLGPQGIVHGRLQQAAAEITATAPIRDSSLWVDGRVVNIRGGGTSPKHITMYGTVTVRPGRHVGLAFARTAKGAGAVAWQFASR